MSLKICILGSGSSGNCTYVSSETTSLLIDAGLSGRETARRLEAIDVDIESIQAICLSHEHNDHASGARVLHRRHGISLYANGGTIEALRQDPKQRELEWNVFTTGASYTIGDIEVEPFSVPHDAYDPVGFVLTTGKARLGVALDMGMATTLIRDKLKSCSTLVVESNYDDVLLQEALRPWHLKKRIMGRQGHLSNNHAAEMVAELAGPHLKKVFLAHISSQCNRGELALGVTRRYLKECGQEHIGVSVAYPDRVSEVWMCG